jgi:hypothetical protein
MEQKEASVHPVRQGRVSGLPEPPSTLSERFRASVRSPAEVMAESGRPEPDVYVLGFILCRCNPLMLVDQLLACIRRSCRRFRITGNPVTRRPGVVTQQAGRDPDPCPPGSGACISTVLAPLTDLSAPGDGDLSRRDVACLPGSCRSGYR